MASAITPCGCDHSRRLTTIIRMNGEQLEIALPLLTDQRVSRGEKQILLDQLIGLARSMKAVP
jgi:hypothetical protein